MAVLLRALGALFPVLRLRPWVLSGMIILGVLAALSEGLSISLFIPLVQDQIGTKTARSAGLAEFFQGIPSQHRLLLDRCQHLAVHGAAERSELFLSLKGRIVGTFRAARPHLQDILQVY